MRIRITDNCASCFHQAGACTVSVTGDGTIRVAPTTRNCDCPVCGACPDICVRVEVSCHTPPLEPGAYRVESPSGVTMLVVDEASEPAMEICAGSADSG